ncbi:MAG: hypothetical protein WCO02_08710 [Bacteroidota bacterium]
MEQEDFLKRQIDQLGRALGRILAGLMGLKVRLQSSPGIEAADHALKTELGLNLDDLCLIPAESFLTAMIDTKKFSDNNFEQLAEIMFLVAEDLNIKGAGALKAEKLYERALLIFEILDKTSTTYSFDRHRKIEKIKNRAQC